MKTISRLSIFTMIPLALVLSSGLLAQQQPAEEPAPEGPQSVVEALKKGKADVGLRLRFEDVSQDGFAKDAHALTLRTTVGYTTAAFKGFSFKIEAENVAELGNDLYNNAGRSGSGNGVRDRPVVADPALTEISQVFLRYDRGDTELSLGRRELILGDARFIGNVGWRQHHQAFDAFTFHNSSLDRVTFDYGFISRTHRIFGDSQSMASHYLNAAIKAGGAGTVTLYGYLLDYDRRQDSGRSSTTWGAELKGGNKKLHWELEAAQQSDAGDNPREIDAGYLHALFGAKLEPVTVKLGFEVLEGSSRDGQFNTPLATLHKFNGWADKFLATPTIGLEDLYLSVGGKVGNVGWVAIYHDFSAESRDVSYGEEIDVQLTYKAPWGQGFGVKGAFYDADRFATDTDKLMVWSTYSF